MQNKKAASFLGLAMKAGKVLSGEFLCENAIRDGKAKLIIIANDASLNTSKKFKDKCTYYSIPYRICFSKEELGNFIGKEARAVAALTDEGFAKNLIKNIDI